MRAVLLCSALFIAIVTPATVRASFFKPVPKPSEAEALVAVRAIMQRPARIQDLPNRIPGLTVQQRSDMANALQQRPEKALTPDQQSKMADLVETLTARAEATKKYAWRPVVTIPALKITGPTRTNSKVDAQLLTSVGGGISYERLVWDTSKGDDGGWRSTFSLSPATILIAGDTKDKDAKLDISYAMTAGFWDNIVMFGAGYDLGEVDGRGRWFGVLSLGINFNN